MTEEFKEVEKLQIVADFLEYMKDTNQERRELEAEIRLLKDLWDESIAMKNEEIDDLVETVDIYEKAIDGYNAMIDILGQRENKIAATLLVIRNKYGDNLGEFQISSITDDGGVIVIEPRYRSDGPLSPVPGPPDFQYWMPAPEDRG